MERWNTGALASYWNVLTFRGCLRAQGPRGSAEFQRTRALGRLEVELLPHPQTLKPVLYVSPQVGTYYLGTVSP